jgi:hypothetical protein
MAGGRPQADTEARRESVVAVRLTAAQRAQLDARASSAGLPLPDFMRAALVDAPPTRRRQAVSARATLSAEELRALNAVGVNLNQIARSLNMGERRPVHDDLQEAIAALQTIFGKYLK